MALPDSTTQTPVFLQIEPNWIGQIRLSQGWVTDVATAHSGTEQRARRREVPRYSLDYRYDSQDLGTFSARHMSMIKEMGAPLVLPIWPHKFTFISEASDVVTLNVTSGVQLSKTAFQVGQYAYFRDDLGVLSPTFRLITAINDLAGTITCEAGTVSFPVGGSVQPYSFATVWPALFGLRRESAFSVERKRVNLTDETMEFDQL